MIITQEDEAIDLSKIESAMQTQASFAHIDVIIISID